MRSASLETRHACAFLRTGAPYKRGATGDTVTRRERAVRGHSNELWVGLVRSAIVITQHATPDPLQIPSPIRSFRGREGEGKACHTNMQHFDC